MNLSVLIQKIFVEFTHIVSRNLAFFRLFIQPNEQCFILKNKFGFFCIQLPTLNLKFFSHRKTFGYDSPKTFDSTPALQFVFPSTPLAVEFHFQACV